jgi:hypothetical protein
LACCAPARTRARPGFGVLFVVYVAIGAGVAYAHDYWSSIDTGKEILSALLATLLWPLLLLGINLHIHEAHGPQASQAAHGVGRFCV